MEEFFNQFSELFLKSNSQNFVSFIVFYASIVFFVTIFISFIKILRKKSQENLEQAARNYLQNQIYVHKKQNNNSLHFHEKDIEQEALEKTLQKKQKIFTKKIKNIEQESLEHSNSDHNHRILQSKKEGKQSSSEKFEKKSLKKLIQKKEDIKKTFILKEILERPYF